MNLDEVAGIVTSWLDAVDVESAETRADDLLKQVVHRDAARVTEANAWKLRSAGPLCKHEAAHAIVGYQWGEEVTRVVIHDDADMRSGVTFTKSNSAIGNIVLLLAGPIAELFLDMEYVEARKSELKDSSDILRAAALIARELALTNRAAAIMSAVSVRSNWDAIVRVGAILQARGEIDGNMLVSLCSAPN